MNESAETRPPQADLNEGLDNVQEAIDKADMNGDLAKKWLGYLEDTKAREAPQRILEEVNRDRPRLMKEREDLLGQMDKLLETIGEEQAIDLAGALLRSEAALQKSIEAQQEASVALTEAREIAFSEPLTDQELSVAEPIVDEVTSEFPDLTESARARNQRRAARLVRLMPEEEVVVRLREELRREQTGIDVPKAWTDAPRGVV